VTKTLRGLSRFHIALLIFVVGASLISVSMVRHPHAELGIPQHIIIPNPANRWLNPVNDGMNQQRLAQDAADPSWRTLGAHRDSLKEL